MKDSDRIDTNRRDRRAGLDFDADLLQVGDRAAEQYGAIHHRLEVRGFKFETLGSGFDSTELEGVFDQAEHGPAGGID